MIDKEQAKLTLAEVERIAANPLSRSRDGALYSYEEVELARALLASQTALRSGCGSCIAGLPLVNHERFGWTHKTDRDGVYMGCQLPEEHRAALLEKGDGDATAN